MPTTDINPRSRYRRFSSSPLRWSVDDIESQQSHQPIIPSFQETSPRIHHSPEHSRNQHSIRHGSMQTRDSPPPSAVEDHDIEDPSTQISAQNIRQTLTQTPIQRPRSTSNPELQFSIPGSFTPEKNMPSLQSGNRTPYSNDFTPQRGSGDRDIDLEGQYSSMQNPRNHLEYDLDNSFVERYRRISDIRNEHSTPHFENRTKESQSPHSKTQDPHQNANPGSTSRLTQKRRRRSYPGNESLPAELPFNPRNYTIDDIESQRFRAPKPPNHPIELDFSRVIQTLRRPLDFFGGKKEETKEMWQCVPNEDLEEGMLGCYAWNHEDKDVCVSCRRVRVREERSRLVALKRALGFKG
ncbi:hypothetical protein EAE96_008805 [Botrytis aclada]|nr:hypothetical protein EAE96_008805 [Botrytis aclada]